MVICKRNGICSSRSINRPNLLYISLITLCAFWAGVGFSHYIIDSSKPGISPKPKLKHFEAIVETQHDVLKHTDLPGKLVTRKKTTDDGESGEKGKKLILLYGDDIWTKYDKWSRMDWRKCPPKWSNCRITTDKSRLSEVDSVVYNSMEMPKMTHVNKIKGDTTIKRVFLSGATPLQTIFDPQEYNDFFDLTVTYKNESNVRIPYWPNDGLLPAMYRPKHPGKFVEEEGMLDLEEDITDYFQKFGKESFMAYTIKDCTEKHYPTLFVGKLREEGFINTYSLNDSIQCKSRIKDTTVLPCKGIDSDDCVKHFEKFKFVIVADEYLCTDYTTRDYWKAIFAWQAVPLLYGASDYSSFLIPNSYIDAVGNEDYVSPSFKKAYGPSQDSQKYYKKFHLWRHEDRVEKYHWPCELCRELNKYSVNPKKVDMETFWNKNTDCGSSLRVHELMRLQLVRTGVISG